MLNYVIKRLLGLIPTLLIVAVLVFLFVHMLPGDPARLIAGPDAENEELYPVINSATKVLGVTVKDGTCYVNLDNGFLTQTYNVSAEVQIYSIVNSLVELSNINKVQIAVNGNTDMIFREKISLSNVFDRNLDLVYETEDLQS